MSRPVVTNELEYRRALGRDVNELKRRGRGRDLGLNGSYRTALLDPAYRGPGPARVTFINDPGGLSTDAYHWLMPYDPVGSSVVNMLRMNGTWVIASQSGDSGLGGWDHIPLLNGWRTYNMANAQAVWAGFDEGFRGVRLVSGIVVLDGLIQAPNNVIAAGDIIAQLPQNMWPDRYMTFQANNSDLPRAVTIRPDGTVRAEMAMSANSYVSLDNIAYPAAGVATWTAVGAAGSGTAFANSWASANTGTYGAVSYWLDPYGVVWWAGQIAGGVTGAGTSMVTGPTTLNAFKQFHMSVPTTGGFGVITSRPSTGPSTGALLVTSTGLATNSVWLGGVAVPTVSAMTLLEWVQPALVSSWINYDVNEPSFPRFRLTRRPDGLCMSMGLVAGGTLGARMTVVPDRMMPAKRTLRQTVSADARARIDIAGMNDWEGANMPGQVNPAQGSAAWFSFDNMKWVAG